MDTKRKPGRPPLAPRVVQIAVKIPQPMLLRIDSVAIDEICRGRSEAVRLLLERGAMRVRLKGINSISKKLADGRTVTYWYAWKGGPALRGQPGSPEFVASFNEAVAHKVVPKAGVILSIVQ